MRLKIVRPLHVGIPGDHSSLMLWVGKLTLWVALVPLTWRVTHWRGGLYWASIGPLSFRWGILLPPRTPKSPAPSADEVSK